MKIILIITLILSLALPLAAADFQTINQESLNTFIQFYPRYIDLAQKYGQKVELENPHLAAIDYRQELEKLSAQFGISLEDFSYLMQKISVGFASYQMEESGMGSMFDALGKQMGQTLTPEERALIKKYSSQLEEILER